MITIDRFEETVRALIQGDKAAALASIEQEIQKEKTRGRHKTVMRLRNLLREVADGGMARGVSGASYRSKVISTINTGNQLYKLGHTDVTFADVVLTQENENIVTSLVNEWSNIEKLQKHGLSPNNRILMYGEPGTGKTKLAHAIANEIGYEILTVHLDELISSYLGKTGKNIREIFEVAKLGKKIIFLDEIDAIAKMRNDSQDTGELKRVVTVFLQNMDELPEDSLVIGATNHEELLDKAIWRRFPVRLKLDTPDLNSRKRLIKLFLKDNRYKLDIPALAALSEGLNGSAIEEVVKSTVRKSILTHEPVNMVDAVKAIMMHNVVESTEKSRKKHWKQALYDSAQFLLNDGYSMKQIESISGIPYTTLREHIK